MQHLGKWRIGELSRRADVSVHLLRAWERRYQLLRPARTPGGYRLYGPDDERRIALMKAHLAEGLRPAEAAQAALSALPVADPHQPAVTPGDAPLDVPPSTSELERAGVRLGDALGAFDAAAAENAFDALLAGWTIETVLRDVVVPYLRRLGDRWQRHEVTVAQEHFASNLLRARLGSLSRGWGQGRGRVALLACPPGELHDLPLLIFGITLNRQGWRIRYLGQDVPLADVAGAAQAVKPALIVLPATVPDHFAKHMDALADLARTYQLAIAGHGSSPKIAAAVGARHLAHDPVTAAHEL